MNEHNIYKQRIFQIKIKVKCIVSLAFACFNGEVNYRFRIVWDIQKKRLASDYIAVIASFRWFLSHRNDICVLPPT